MCCMQLCFLFYRNCQLKRLFLLEFNRCLALVTKLPKLSKQSKNFKRCITNICKNCLLYWQWANKIRGLAMTKNRKKILERNKTCRVKTSHPARVKSFNDDQFSLVWLLLLSVDIESPLLCQCSALYWGVMSINGREGQGGSRPRLLTGVRMGLIKQRLNWNK